MPRLEGIHPNLAALLDTIAWAEGTCEGRHPLTQMDGYDVIVTGSAGPEIFTDFAIHPFEGSRMPKHIKGRLYSTAAGRYQILARYWPHYRDVLHLQNFGPEAQDAYAIRQIKECGALEDIKHGDFETAIKKCASIWASLPGAGYGQHEQELETLRKIYLGYGGR